MKKKPINIIKSVQKVGLWILGKLHLLDDIDEKNKTHAELVEVYENQRKAYDTLISSLSLLDDQVASLTHDNEQHISTIQRLNNMLGQKESLIATMKLEHEREMTKKIKKLSDLKALIAAFG